MGVFLRRVVNNGEGPQSPKRPSCSVLGLPAHKRLLDWLSKSGLQNPQNQCEFSHEKSACSATLNTLGCNTKASGAHQHDIRPALSL